MIMVLRADMVTHSQLEPVLTKKSTADPFPAPTQVSHLPTEKVGTQAQALGWLMVPFLLLQRGGLDRNREVAFPACFPHTVASYGADSWMESEGPILVPCNGLEGLAAMAGEGRVGLGGPGCSALCNTCVLLSFVLTSRRRHTNVRLCQAPLWEGVGGGRTA